MGTTSNIETRYLTEEEFGLWDQFVDACQFGTIFHKSNWLRPVARFQGLNFSIVACFKGGKIAGGMAFTWKKKFGLIRVIQMPLKTPFFGPVVAYSDTKYRSKIESQVHSITESLTTFLLSEYQLFHAQFPPAFSDVRPYVWGGFETRVHYTYCGAIDPGASLSEQFEQDVRRRIKKALDMDFQLVVETTEGNIAESWDLEQKSFDRQKFSRLSFTREDFISLVKGLADAGASQIFTIKSEGIPVASVVIIQDPAKSVSYYWMAGAHRDYLNTGLNQLLVQRILEHYQDSDYNIFDMVGADTPTIARYKSTFNFPLVPMYSVTKSRGMARLGMRLKNMIS